MTLRLVVIGGVAAGATAAARARRLREDAEITLLERGPFVSFANCGLPYFLSRDIEDRSDLLLQSPEGLEARYGIRTRVNTEAVEIDRRAKRVLARGPGGEASFAYDKLILAQGGNSLLPPIPGADSAHVFRLWTIPDMDRLHDFIEQERPKSAVVVGGGFVGLEMVEAFARRKLSTAVVELLPTLMPQMDREFGVQIARELSGRGIRVETGVGVKAVHASERSVELADGRRLPADLVLFSVGVRPELSLAKQAGLEIGRSGGVLVDDRLQTTDPDIFAAGDMVEVVHRISGQRARVPLAGPANRQGRIAATNALGGDLRYSGPLGTSVVKIFDATAAMTGLTEKVARSAFPQVGVALIFKDHHAGYYPGAQELSLKLVYDKATARLLGAQSFGRGGVDKRIDVLATALRGGFTLHDLAELDLAYAPPYSSANDPINLAAFIGENDLSGYSPLVTPAQLKAELAGSAPPLVLDVRTQKEHGAGHIRGSLLVPVDELRSKLGALPRDRRIVIHCRSGFRAHVALRILKEHGFKDVANVTGGFLSISAEGGFDLEES